jgi:hypothetical protein
MGALRARLNIVRELARETFPSGEVHQLNELRNKFAHQKGEELRNAYTTDGALLESYELLARTHNALNNYWASRYGIE